MARQITPAPVIGEDEEDVGSRCIGGLNSERREQGEEQRGEGFHQTVIQEISGLVPGFGAWSGGP